MYQLTLYVPVEHAEQVKEAVFSTGAGTLGHYSRCCFETVGTGQFQPDEHANPAIKVLPNIGVLPNKGDCQTLARVEELKIDILCTASQLEAAIARFEEAHPYEHPVYAVFRLEPQ